MSSLRQISGAFGLLPLAAPALAFIALRLGALVFPASAAHALVGGSVLALALVITTVRILGALQVFTPLSAFGCLIAATAACIFIGARPRLLRFRVRELLSVDALPLVGLAALALGIASLTALWLPVWHWDSLCYHLPWVNYFLQGKGHAAVPVDWFYLSTYPHNVELFTVALRAMLPDDRLIDIAQLPLALLGVLAVGGIARLHGAERPHAVAAGCAWLLVPAIFLQLPSNYVDVGAAALYLAAAYFVLAPPSTRTMLLAGIALGLFLGSKPSAPPATVALAALLLVRGLRARLPVPTLLLSLLLVAGFGAESYLTNLIRHGNPTWPVAVSLGPIHFPGPASLAEVMDASPELSARRGPLLLRLLASWLDFGSRPTYDMRLGGYGPLFLCVFPFALVTLVRARAVAATVAMLAVFANPYPTWARFVFAVTGFALAFAAPWLNTLAARSRALVLATASLIGAYQLVYAYPGLTGSGPPLFAYAHLSRAERARAVGPTGDPTKYARARALIAPGESYAIDPRTEFNYYAWDSELSYPVVPVPIGSSIEEVERLLRRENVRVFNAAERGPLGRWVRASPSRARALFRCDTSSCTVYERQRP